MNINDLIAWHRHKAESTEATRRNAARQARDGRSTAATRSGWHSDASLYQEQVVFHRNAVQLLEGIKS